MKIKFKKFVVALLIFCLSVTSTQVNAAALEEGQSLGSGFVVISGLNVDDSGNLYLYDPCNGKLIKMDNLGSAITTVFDYSSIKQSVDPAGIAIDNSGHIYFKPYLSDNQIERIDTDGSNLTDITLTYTQPVSGPAISLLRGMTISSNTNKLYFADWKNGRIMRTNLDGTDTIAIKTNYDKDTINSVAVDSNENIYAVDFHNGKVYKMDSSGNNETTLISGLYSPTGICIDKEDNIYVLCHDSIVKLDCTGKILKNITGSVHTSSDTECITIDNNGYLYYGGMQNYISKYVGSAQVISSKEIKIEFNNTLSGVNADPSAFTIQGVASNPKVVSTTISGSSIVLMLDKEISATDSQISIAYQKTGTNDLVNGCTGKNMDSFTELYVKNNLQEIIAIVSPTIHFNVANGTPLSSISLPITVDIQTSKSKMNVGVTWDSGNPV